MRLTEPEQRALSAICNGFKRALNHPEDGSGAAVDAFVDNFPLLPVTIANDLVETLLSVSPDGLAYVVEQYSEGEAA